MASWAGSLLLVSAAVVPSDAGAAGVVATGLVGVVVPVAAAAIPAPPIAAPATSAAVANFLRPMRNLNGAYFRR